MDTTHQSSVGQGAQGQCGTTSLPCPLPPSCLLSHQVPLLSPEHLSLSSHHISLVPSHGVGLSVHFSTLPAPGSWHTAGTSQTHEGVSAQGPERLPTWRAVNAGNSAAPSLLPRLLSLTTCPLQLCCLVCNQALQGAQSTLWVGTWGQRRKAVRQMEMNPEGPGCCKAGSRSFRSSSYISGPSWDGPQRQ